MGQPMPCARRPSPGTNRSTTTARLVRLKLVGCLPKVDRCWTSPELRTRQTAEALGLSADIQPMLRECDYGRWAGKKFSEIAADEPDAANSWLRDPAAAPHGGESILDLMRRVATVARRRTVARPTVHRYHPFNDHTGDDRSRDGCATSVVSGALISDRCRSRG